MLPITPVIPLQLAVSVNSILSNQPLLHIEPQVHQPAAPQQQVASHLVRGDVGPGHVGNRRPAVLQCGTVSQPQYNNPSFSNQGVQFKAQSDPPQHQSIVTYCREYRCSPTTGRQWIVDVPVTSELQQPVSQPEFKTEWRIHPYSGTPYQVQVPVPPQHPVQAQQVHPNQVTPPQFLPTQWPLNQLPSEQQHHISQQLQVPPQLAAAQNNSPNFPVAQHDQQFRHEWRIHPQTGTTYQVQVPVQVQRVQHKPVHHQVTRCRTLDTKFSHIQHLSKHCSTKPQGLYANPHHSNLLILSNSSNRQEETLPKTCPVSRLQQSFSQYCDLKDNSSLTRQDQVAGIVSMVENEVDQKLASWQNMQAGVRTSTLLSSQMEHPRPAQTRDPKNVEKKELCTTYNKCKTECSYCREKKKQSRRHQAWCCQNKVSEG